MRHLTLEVTGESCQVLIGLTAKISSSAWRDFKLDFSDDSSDLWVTSVKLPETTALTLWPHRNACQLLLDSHVNEGREEVLKVEGTNSIQGSCIWCCVHVWEAFRSIRTWDNIGDRARNFSHQAKKKKRGGDSCNQYLLLKCLKGLVSTFWGHFNTLEWQVGDQLPSPRRFAMSSPVSLGAALSYVEGRCRTAFTRLCWQTPSRK